jgi:hypothetical protein
MTSLPIRVITGANVVLTLVMGVAMLISGGYPWFEIVTVFGAAVAWGQAFIWAKPQG